MFQQVEQLEKDLRIMRTKALPFATKSTINRAAFETQRHAKSIVKSDMINRNKYTEQSIRVDQARTLTIRDQEAIVGSIADYMATQEFGGQKDDPTIATSYSAGQSGGKRTRLPRRPNQVKNIQLRGTRASSAGRTRGQQNFVAVKRAAARGDKFVYLKGDRFEGLFRLLGGKRRPRVRMVHDLSRKTVDIPRSPWLSPATRKVEPQLDKFYADALRFQLRRIGL